MCRSPSRPPRFVYPQSAMLGHPVCAVLLIPLGGHLLRACPELDRSLAGDIADSKARLVPSAERERLSRNRNSNVYSNHSRGSVFHNVSRNTAGLGQRGSRVSIG